MLVKTRKQEKIVCPSHEKKNTLHTTKKIKIKDVKLISSLNSVFCFWKNLKKNPTAEK
jgi:hypothetical protein